MNPLNLNGSPVVWSDPKVFNEMSLIEFLDRSSVNRTPEFRDMSLGRSSSSSSSNNEGDLHDDLDISDVVFKYINRMLMEENMEENAFNVHDLIPYKNINGLKHAKDQIEEAVKVVCESHNLDLAQVWIAYESNNNVPFPYSLEDTQTKQVIAVKLTGYLHALRNNGYEDFKPHFRFGDATPLAVKEKFPLVTLQDYEPRYISMLRSDMVKHWHSEYSHPTCAFAICLKSSDSSDFDYVFEFIWTKHSNYVILLEALLLTLKRCLPKFKFASGVELGNELDVIVTENTTDGEGSEISETGKIKIFQEKRLPPMSKAPEKGKKPMVVDLVAPSKVTCKTTPKVLPREVIHKQFGKPMKEAAENLKVSLSTLKRKSKELGILEWPGRNFMKRNANDLSVIQINTNEEDNGATEDTSTVNLKQETMTLKAEYADDMIKLDLPISQATFVTVEKEIGMKLKLHLGTFKLKYIDEDEDWISLTSDKDMNDCINSSRKSDRIVARLRVLPSPIRS